ncbi:MAG: hypothetical protein NW218_17675 [Saprospiraceae bacterium]|nr:hypothetical protein [Saprospiraceae bacterium]
MRITSESLKDKILKYSDLYNPNLEDSMEELQLSLEQYNEICKICKGLTGLGDTYLKNILFESNILSAFKVFEAKSDKLFDEYDNIGNSTIQDQLVSDFDKSYKTLREYLYLIDHSKRIETFADELEQRVALEQAVKTFQERNKVWGEMISAAKIDLSEIGIREYEQVFGNESNEFKKTAMWWLIALLVSLGALIIIGLIYLPQIPEGASGGKIAEVIFRKVVVISGLFYMIALFSRNYKASMHNSLVNRHRQNALKTFQIFIKSVQDDDLQTKNAVLLKATETIFGNQPSGFLPDSGDGDMSPKIIEIFKNFPTMPGK